MKRGEMNESQRFALRIKRAERGSRIATWSAGPGLAAAGVGFVLGFAEPQMQAQALGLMLGGGAAAVIVGGPAALYTFVQHNIAFFQSFGVHRRNPENSLPEKYQNAQFWRYAKAVDLILGPVAGPPGIGGSLLGWGIMRYFSHKANAEVKQEVRRQIG